MFSWARPRPAQQAEDGPGLSLLVLIAYLKYYFTLGIVLEESGKTEKLEHHLQKMDNAIHPLASPSHYTLTSIWPLIFTALHGMQTRFYDEISVCLSVCLSVRLSVCPSVKRVHCDKTEERYV